MARLATSGFELNDIANASASAPENVPTASGGGLTAAVVSTANPRSGVYHARCVSAGANNTYVTASFTTATTVTVYARAGMCVSALPSTGGVVLMDLQANARTTGQIFLATDGSVQRVAAGTGGPNVITAGTYFVLECSLMIDTANAANDTFAWRLNGTLIETVTTAMGTTLPSVVRIGVAPGSALPANTINLDVDDVVVNDSTGANENTWPGLGKIVLLKPASLNTNGGSWTDSAAATTSAALADAIDNTPPTGIADTTASAGHQDRNAAANTNLDMNLTTYTTAGIGATDTVNLVLPFVNVGAPVVTGAKTGSFGISANPVIANRVFTGGATAAANFWRGVAAGTYPTGWGWEVGTLTYVPTVTLGSAPVARLSITAGTTSRIALADLLGLLVDYTPAVVAATPTPNVTMAPQRA